MHAASQQAARDRSALGGAPANGAAMTTPSDPSNNHNALSLSDGHHGRGVVGGEFADEAGKRRRRAAAKDGAGGGGAGGAVGGGARVTNPWTANGHNGGGTHAHTSGSGGGQWWEQIQAADEGYAPSGFKHLAVPTGFTAARSESPLPHLGLGPGVGVHAASLVDVSANPYASNNGTTAASMAAVGAHNDSLAAAAAPNNNNINNDDSGLVWGMTRAEARACGLLEDEPSPQTSAHGADVAALAHGSGPGGVSDPDLLFASLLEMGFAEDDAHDAAFRCSSLEAAVEAINNKTDPEFLRQLAEAEQRAATASAAAVARSGAGGVMMRGVMPANAAQAQAQAVARDAATAAALAAADAADAAADAARRGCGGGGGGDGWETVPRRNAGGAKANVMAKNAVEVLTRLIATKKARTKRTQAHGFAHAGCIFCSHISLFFFILQIKATDVDLPVLRALADAPEGVAFEVRSLSRACIS
jgi:hypothetical protein